MEELQTELRITKCNMLAEVHEVEQQMKDRLAEKEVEIVAKHTEAATFSSELSTMEAESLSSRKLLQTELVATQLQASLSATEATKLHSALSTQRTAMQTAVA